MDRCRRSYVGVSALGSGNGSYPNDAIPPSVIQFSKSNERLHSLLFNLHYISINVH